MTRLPSRLPAGARVVTLAVSAGLAATAAIALSPAAGAAAATYNALDTLNRSVPMGLGVAEVGGSWAVQTPAYLSVTPKVARVDALPAGVSDSAYIKKINTTDEMVRMNFALPTALPKFANGVLFSAETRMHADGSAIADQIKVSPDGTLTMTLQEVTASGTTAISKPYVASTKLHAGRGWTVDLQTTGTAPTYVLARVYRAGSVVPPWQVTNAVNDGQITTAPGAVGFAVQTPLSSVGVPVTMNGLTAWPIHTPTVVSLSMAPAAAVANPAPVGTSTINIDTTTALGKYSNNEAGLSFEYNDLVGGVLAPTPQLVTLLKNLGPGVMRIGGNTLDLKAQTGPTAAQLTALNSLLTQTGWKVIYSVTLMHFDAAAQGAEVKAAWAALGSNVAAFVCGNEPNVYVQHGYLTSYTVSDYLSAETTCLNTIRSNAPGAPLAGPDTSNGGWLPDFLATKPANLVMVDQHMYPFNVNTAPNVTATDLLTPDIATHAASVVTMEAKLAAGAGVPLRLTEDATIAGGGKNGVSDTYVAALWGSDFGLNVAENGATGVEMHQTGNDTTCSTMSAVCRPGGGAWTAQEPYYGLLMDRQMGTGTLVANSGAGGANVGVHVVRHSDGSLAVMLVNRAATDFTGTVASPTTVTSATTELLTAASLSATSGITIGGQQVQADGSFPAPTTTPVTNSAGSVTITVPAYSAMIINLV